jgi:lysozyme
MARPRFKLYAASALATATIAMGVARPHEGLRLLAYLDPVGVPTICAGITKGVKLGDIATEQECDAREQQAMLLALDTVRRCTNDAALSQNEWAAWGSFTYNVGPGRKGVKDGFCVLKSGNEPTLLRLIKIGRFADACRELPKWVKAGGIRFAGLVKRRDDEMRICLIGARGEMQS